MAAKLVRPSSVCRALLEALEAAEGRRRSRKRDQTPDALGLGMKRDLLESAVAQDPDESVFEDWLLAYARSRGDAPGAALAMARAVLEDWRLAQALPDFSMWLEEGAPSEDAAALRGEPGRRV